ncbi:MAG TPA: glycosyltransferase [Bacteroidota bacterium]
MRKIDLDIIQPCYNPSHDWAESVWLHFQDLMKLLPGVNINLVIVNDGSQKNVSGDSVDFLRERIENFQFISYDPNRGKGYALRMGITASRGPVQICTDIDFPYELVHIQQMYTLLNGNADIVCGVRNRRYYDTLPSRRLIASKTSQMLNQMFLRLPFSDTQSGIKGFNGKGRRIMLGTTIERYLVDTEFLAIAAREKNLSIVPFEVSLRDNVKISRMKTKVFIHEFRNFVRIYSNVR